MPDQPSGLGKLMAPVKAILAMPNDSPRKIIIVAVVLCLVCSVIVSAAAIGLRPLQEVNKQLEIKRNILQVAGLMRPGASIDELFKQIEPRVVDLRTGDFSDAVDPATYDQRAAARDPAQSEALPISEDLASIKRQAHYATVYLVKGEDGKATTVILPVHGYGLWSTLYGYLAVKPDGRQIVGLQFYEHAETPGLGGEVDNPSWRGQWPEKLIFDDDGNVKIDVVKGAATSGPDADYEVDGLAGATLTSRGVGNLVRYWAGENGFGPFLMNLQQRLADNG
ncbi:MAG: Na(+)-translocating NADH-quinone reductase subunit C [Pseudomonadota bacterium]